jgi:hypothetical protein
MTQRHAIPHDLRRLFLSITRNTLASSLLGACASDHPRADSEHEQTDGAITTTPLDAASSSVPQDAAARDSGEAPRKDGGSPDATSDGGPQDASKDGGPQDATTDGAAQENWSLVPCPKGGLAEPAGGLQAKSNVDSIGIYGQSSAQAWENRPALPDGGLPRSMEYAARVGAACWPPNSDIPCKPQQTALVQRECAAVPCRYAVITQADTYQRLDTRAELLALFGSIDTAAEAVLLAAFDNKALCRGLGSDPRDIGTEFRPTASGFELRTTREVCGVELATDVLRVTPEGVLTLLSHEKLKDSQCAAGRRPPGLCPEPSRVQGSRAGAFLADVARLEHASIYAFYQLICELSAHGAPEELRLLALDAMLDEVRHAHEVGELARAYGAEVRWAQVEPTAPRSLLDIALDNASEGCVRETFGALLATYQEQTAADLRVREVMAQIARDETQHAQLSWKLMAWLEPQLSEQQQAQVAAAQARAQIELELEPVPTLNEAERHALGLPDREHALTLLAQLRRAFLAGVPGDTLRQRA